MDKQTEQSDDKKLNKLGITRTSIEVFHVGPYKYSNLKDAIAEAERVNAEKTAAKPAWKNFGTARLLGWNCDWAAAY